MKARQILYCVPGITPNVPLVSSCTGEGKIDLYIYIYRYHPVFDYYNYLTGLANVTPSQHYEFAKPAKLLSNTAISAGDNVVIAMCVL